MRSYQLRGDLLPSRNWSFGPLLQRRPGRSGVDDPRVDNLSDIDPAWEAGAHFGYRLGIDPNNPATTLGINIQAAADISDESNGWLMQPGLDYITRFSPQWLFNARLFSTYADQNYMQEYFGIGASNVRDSGLRFYNADDGFKDVGVRRRRRLPVQRALERRRRRAVHPPDRRRGGQPGHQAGLRGPVLRRRVPQLSVLAIAAPSTSGTGARHRARFRNRAGCREPSPRAWRLHLPGAR